MWEKRGSCAVRDTESRNWQIDENIPVFTQDRAYIEQWLTLHSSLNCGETTLAEVFELMLIEGVKAQWNDDLTILCVL